MLKPVAIARQAPAARAVRGMALDVGDAAVPERGQVRNHLGDCVALVDHHADAAIRFGGGNARPRDAEFVQALQQCRVVGDRRGQHDAVDLRLQDQRLDLGNDVHGIVDQGHQHEVVVLGLAGVEHAELDLHQVVAGRVVVQHRHQVRAPPGQHPGGRMRAVAHPLDHRLHSLAGGLGHVRLMVEHAGDGLDRHARFRRHILDPNACHVLAILSVKPRDSARSRAAPFRAASGAGRAGDPAPCTARAGRIRASAGLPRTRHRPRGPAIVQYMTALSDRPRPAPRRTTNRWNASR